RGPSRAQPVRAGAALPPHRGVRHWRPAPPGRCAGAGCRRHAARGAGARPCRGAALRRLRGLGKVARYQLLWRQRRRRDAGGRPGSAGDVPEGVHGPVRRDVRLRRAGCKSKTVAVAAGCAQKWTSRTAGTLRRGSCTRPPRGSAPGIPFFVSSTRSPAALWILMILLVVIIIALLVYYLKKKALCCFKAAPKKEEAVVLVQEEDRQAFKEMDLDGDGVITPEELAQYRQERQCGRNCTNMCAGGKNDKEDDKDNKDGGGHHQGGGEAQGEAEAQRARGGGHWEYVKDHH
ncbi:unnamed protein product, partial [Prorocentrum cordatum]